MCVRIYICIYIYLYVYMYIYMDVLGERQVRDPRLDRAADLRGRTAGSTPRALLSDYQETSKSP